MNVIVICCDTLRADVMDHTWEDHVNTPNLDDLRRSCTVFTNAWGEGEPTIPMRRGFFTGIRSYPWRYHLDDRGSFPNLHGWHAIPTEHTTTAERCIANGVCTGLVTDVYHMFKPTMNFTRGFMSYDFIRGQEADMVRSGPLADIDIARHMPDELATPEKSPGMAQYLLNVKDRQSEEDYFAPRVFRSASRWVQDNHANQPFFLWIDSFAPHEHWDPPVHFADAYYEDGSVRDFIYPQMVQRQRKLTEAEIKRTKALYYGYVTFVDKWIGHFLNTLADLSLWDDTMVLFVSDHGTELMDKTQFGKSPMAMHPYNFRLNCWVRHPDRAFHNQANASYVQNIDLAPTILEALGIEHEELDGRSLLPLVSGEGAPIRDHVITGWGPWAGVRTSEWNLIINTMERGAQARLFNHPRDVDESHDVAADNPTVVSELQGKLETLLGGRLPTTYVHQPTGKYNASFQQWAQSNLAR